MTRAGTLLRLNRNDEAAELLTKAVPLEPVADVKQGRRRLVPVAALAEYVADLERVA